MAPPKAICSVYAEVFAIYARLLTTISDIKKVLSKAISIKNSIRYGLVSIGDATLAEIVSVATAVAQTLAKQVMTKASALVSTAIEAVLGPLLTIVLAGPESIFALVGLPLGEAIRATDSERLHLTKAKADLDLVLSIFSKWTLGFGGARYASKMRQSLPFIQAAIDNCADVISKLDSNDDSGLSAQFDQGKYNSLRANLLSAIQITESDPVVANTAILEQNIQDLADAKIIEATQEINSKYKIDKQKVAEEYISGEQNAFTASKYSVQIKALDSKKKVDIQVVKSKYTNEAVLNSSVYDGIFTDAASQFNYDMQQLEAALRRFVENIGSAYGYYKESQALTYSTYSIQTLINILIETLIRLIGTAGNKAAEGLQYPLQLSLSLMESVQELYTEALEAFNSPNDSISSTELATQLAGGNGLLAAADQTMAASITQSLIDAVNADEALETQKGKMERLFENIEQIQDWDGTLNVWGVDISNAVSSPYGRLIASTGGILGTMATTGLVPNANAIDVNRKRLSENSKIFRSLIRHNAEVSNALRTYTPPINEYVEELRRSMTSVDLNLFLSGPAAFNVISLVASIAGNLFSGEGFSVDDLPTPNNCVTAYSELFDESFGKVNAIHESMKRPVTFDNKASQSMEELEGDMLDAQYTERTARVDLVDKTDLKGVAE